MVVVRGSDSESFPAATRLLARHRRPAQFLGRVEHARIVSTMAHTHSHCREYLFYIAFIWKERNAPRRLRELVRPENDGGVAKWVQQLLSNGRSGLPKSSVNWQ